MINSIPEVCGLGPNLSYVSFQLSVFVCSMKRRVYHFLFSFNGKSIVLWYMYCMNIYIVDVSLREWYFNQVLYPQLLYGMQLFYQRNFTCFPINSISMRLQSACSIYMVHTVIDGEMVSWNDDYGFGINCGHCLFLADWRLNGRVYR